MVRVVYAFIIIAVLGYLVWPYASLYNLFTDLKSADVEAVREHADWSSVRKNLANDLEGFSKRAAGNAFATGTKGARISLAWDALPIADEIAGVFATPQGLIALHRNPRAISCAVNALRSFRTEAVSECLEIQRSAPAQEKQPGGFQGPNFSRLFEKFEYAFFTGLLSFRFVLLHEGIPVTLNFTRKAEGWLLVSIRFPFERAMALDQHKGG